MACSDAAFVPVHGPARQGPQPAGEPLPALPLAIVYFTDRCNSRCISCDHWRHGQRDMGLDELAAQLPSLAALGSRVVLVSGGEPLLNPQWEAMARLLRGQGLRLWLLTAGLALAKHADAVAELFESVTVSLDGSSRRSYAAIRGVDAFDAVCLGVLEAVQRGVPVNLRVTVQRANHTELSALVTLARELGASSISFLAADVTTTQAFGRTAPAASGEGIALRPEDLPGLAAELDRLERKHAEGFASGFIAESPAKLRRLLAHAQAGCGQGAFPPVRCNAPEFSAVLEADGALRPCFFIPGPPGPPPASLAQGLNTPAMQALRADIRGQRRPECARCVCAKWRDPGQAEWP